LRSPETSTDPDDIKDINSPSGYNEENEEDNTNDSQEEEEEQKDDSDVIKDFLYNEEENKEEEDQQDEEESPNQEDSNEEEPEHHEDENEEGEGEDNSQFRALGKDLFKLGILTTQEGEEPPEIENAEDLLKSFNEEKKKGAVSVVNNFIGQFGEDYQKAFEAIFVKGVDPKQFFSTYNETVDFADMDLKNEANQESVVRTMLGEQGLEPEDIDEEISTLKEYGDLEKKANKFHKVLVKKKAQKLQEMEDKSEKEQQQKAALRNEYTQNVQSILQDKLQKKDFDGIPINTNIANELQDFLLVDKYRTSSGENLTDFDRTVLELKRPENHEKKVKVALILKMLEKDPTLSTIQKSGVSKNSNKLFEEVARQRTKAKPSMEQQGGKFNSRESIWSRL